MRVLLVCSLLAAAAALPATTKSAKDDVFETFIVSARPRFDFVDDTSDESSEIVPSTSNFNPFNFFFRPISLFPALPSMPDVRSIFRDIGTPSSDPNNKLTNSTTETKVIDGHKVEVKTSYFKNDKTGTMIRTVEVNYGAEADDNDKAGSPTTQHPRKKEDDNEITGRDREPLGDHTTDSDVLNA